MRTTAVSNSPGFGNLATIRGTVRYSISPMEQKTFGGLLTTNLPNLFWRVRKALVYSAPPLIVGYLIFTEANRIHALESRKNPADFADDV